MDFKANKKNKSTREDDDPTTEYQKINERSEQISLSNTMCTTATAKS